MTDLTRAYVNVLPSITALRFGIAVEMDDAVAVCENRGYAPETAHRIVNRMYRTTPWSLARIKSLLASESDFWIEGWNQP